MLYIVVVKCIVKRSRQFMKIRVGEDVFLQWAHTCSQTINLWQ